MPCRFATFAIGPYGKRKTEMLTPLKFVYLSKNVYKYTCIPVFQNDFTDVKDISTKITYDDKTA